MFTRYVEITCDHCGTVDYVMGTVADAKFQMKDLGWILVAAKLTFCSTECQLKGRRH